MLIRLEPSQVSRYWDDIKAALLYSVPPLVNADEEGLNNILTSLLARRMDAWVLCEEGENGCNVFALAVTQEMMDPGTLERNLLIYSLCGYKFVPEKLWQDGFATLRRFARSVGLKRIVAYTKVPRIIEIAKGLGADCSTTLVSWEA